MSLHYDEPEFVGHDRRNLLVRTDILYVQINGGQAVSLSARAGVSIYHFSIIIFQWNQRALLY